MGILIRPYENADAQACCDVWREHFAGCGMAASLSPLMWEFCVVGKIFFRREDFFVALVDDRIVGFAHLTFGENGRGTANHKPAAILNAVCVEPHPLELEVAAVLIQTVVEAAIAHGDGTIRALGGPDRFAQYLLVPPLFGMMGVLASDHRIRDWLTHDKFQPVQPIDCWQVELQTLRLPMDRGQMAVRRACDVARVLTEGCDSWFLANAFGHTEQIRFNLTARGQDRVTQTATFAFMQPSHFRSEKMTAMLLLPTIPADELGVDQLTFLLAESLRQLQFERFSHVIAIAASDQPDAVTLLRRLSFRTSASGVVFERRLPAAI